MLVESAFHASGHRPVPLLRDRPLSDPLFVAYRLAYEKGRFGLLYGFFGWIGVAAVALLPPVYYGGSEKVCPDCAETVLADANVCRFCGYWFADDTE